MSDEEEHHMTDEKKKENLATLENGLWDFFYSALDEYYKKGSKTALERSSSTTPTRLADDLKNLWLAEVKLMGWGVTRPEVRWLQFSNYQALAQTRGDEKRKLFQHGRDYEDFWFGKKHFEEFVEIFERDVDEKIQNDINITFELGYDVLDYFNAENKPSKSEEKKIKKVIEEGIKEGNKRFIEDLKSIRVNLKHILQWKENRLKHFASVWLPYLTFAAVIILGAVQVWLALRN